MKKTRSIGAALAGIALLSLSALPAPAADPPGFETYVVRRGDTLSKIAGRVFGDVKRWREILKKNPQIKNANLIFPGDALLVPIAVATTPSGAAPGLSARSSADTGAGFGTASETGTAGSDVAPAAASEPATMGGATTAVEPPPPPPPPPPAKPTPPPPVVNPRLLSSAGYIADTLPTIAIIAAEDDRLLLANDDAAVVNATLPTGTRFTVVRANRRVFHPKTGLSLGWLIRILGTAEVTCPSEKTSTVVLHDMRDAGGVGDYLVPVDPGVPTQVVLAAKSVLECVSPGAEDGVIVAFDQNKLISAEMELAYIDRGTSSGAAPGRVYTIYRERHPEGPVAVGEIQVLRAGEKTATALITNSLQGVQLGDLLRAP